MNIYLKFKHLSVKYQVLWVFLFSFMFSGSYVFIYLFMGGGGIFLTILNLK